MKIIVAALLLGLAAVAPALASTTFGTIRVQIVDHAGNPLAGVPVYVHGRSSDLKQTTNTSGRVTIWDVTPGAVMVGLGKSEFKSCEVRQLVTAGQIVNMKFEARSMPFSETNCQIMASTNPTRPNPNVSESVYDVFAGDNTH